MPVAFTAKFFYFTFPLRLRASAVNQQIAFPGNLPIQQKTEK